MEFIKPGTFIDFMAHRKVIVSISLVLVTLSIASLFFPGPNYGIDFSGGTELQLKFGGAIQSAEVRKTLTDVGFARPDVVEVQGEENEFIVRVREITTITEENANAIEGAFKTAMGDNEVRDFRISPGGDKISIRLTQPADLELILNQLRTAGADVRDDGVVVFGQTEDNRYEARLVGVGDQVVHKLTEALGAERAPEARRIEWVGPKAGEQLRDAALQSLLYAILFIMIYVAFRFDLRFAPGGILAMTHDALITLGIYVALQKEVNLTTVAALLTIIGYSINDTIVVYDRIRENMGRYRDKSLYDLINISTSQMLSRTIVTSLTTLLSIAMFFIFGTGVIRDISFALFIGICIGTYSSIYVAAPVTEWMDRKFFKKGNDGGGLEPEPEADATAAAAA